MGIIFHRMILTNHHDHHEYHSAQLSPLNIDHIIQDQISKIFKNNVFSSLINIFRVIRNTQTIQAKTHSESRAMLKFCSSMGIVVFFVVPPPRRREVGRRKPPTRAPPPTIQARKKMTTIGCFKDQRRKTTRKKSGHTFFKTRSVLFGFFFF